MYSVHLIITTHEYTYVVSLVTCTHHVITKQLSTRQVILMHLKGFVA